MKDVLTKKKLTHSDDIDHKMKGYITNYHAYYVNWT